uniref:Transposon protein n=1 Tax=Coix lacryma-jobi TaxID=4505 RepID=G8XUM8_COILA|nr:transposon protein [Coix lacryma-jobi]
MGEGEEEASAEDTLAEDDALGDVIRDTQRDCESERRRLSLTEYENLDECPVCKASRYKIRRDDPGDVEDEERLRKKISAKVMWYAPIIPRLKRLFRNKYHAKLRKFIMMLVLIQGPRQPGNDIDVYLRPLVEELLLLWSKSGRVWAIIPPGYTSVSVDRVVKGYNNVELDIKGGDGEKTLGEAKKTFICWHKRYIIIPRASPPPPQQPNPSRTSPNLSPIIHSPHDHSVASDDDQDQTRRDPSPLLAPPSPPRRDPTPPPAPSPPRRDPTPPPAPPSPLKRAPTPPPAPSPRQVPTLPPPTKKRPVTQTKASAPPPPKKTASVRKPALKMTKLAYDMTDEETEAAAQKDLNKFFDAAIGSGRAKRNPEKPYLFVCPEKLRQTVDDQHKKVRASRNALPKSDYDRTLSKSIEEAKKTKKRAGKGVPQLGEQKQQSVPDLVVGNEYGTNMDIIQRAYGDVDPEQLLKFFEETGLNVENILGEAGIISAPEVDKWQRAYVYGQSLYNPAALRDLGTQMHLLNQWYLTTCGRKTDDYICVRIRDHDYFRGDDIIYVQFNELHQLCHMDALDKSLVSCFCLNMMRQLRRKNDKEIGFIDPYIVFKHPSSTPSDAWKTQTERNLRRFFVNQRDKRYILFPYNFSFHWILIVIDLHESRLLIYDSLRKPQEDYQDMIDIIRWVWVWFFQKHRPDLKAQLPDPLRLNWVLRQSPGNNLCAYYVCEFLTVYEKRTHLQNQQETWLKNQVMDKIRLKAI